MNTELNTANVNQPRELAHTTKIFRNGAEVDALNIETTMRIIKGMKTISPSMATGQVYSGYKVTGNGTKVAAHVSANGKIVPESYIYNINAVSTVAESSPKYQQALLAAAEAEEDGDVEKLHDACREIINAVTVSFNARSAQFTKGELVKGQVELVTTERGSLLKLVNVSAMPAIAAPKSTEGFDLRAKIAALRGNAPESSEQAPAPVVNAFENSVQA